MMGINIITANFSNGGRQSITRKLYQYDYGQKVSIRGLSLPSTFEVHISNDNNINTAEVYTGTKNEIEIPDKFLLSGKAIYMWLFLHNAENDGQTRYIITIPVEERPKPQAAVPVTDENTINQLLIAALQNPQQAKNSTGINIVTANFKNERNTITRKLYQYDYGQVINIKGLNLPKAFEVHISNSNKANTAQIYIGNNDQIEIPNKFLISGEDIYLWIFLHSTATDGQTRYTITVPVQKKPKPESEEPTEIERNTIDQLIAALEGNLNEMQKATEDAKTTMDQTTAAAKGQMQLAIDEANDTVSKYPKIVDDYWYVYDVENQVWVNTQIKALAVDGVGIENIVYNNDYTITINLTDGTFYTTNSIRGKKGDKGDIGATPNIKIKTTETIAPNQYASVKIEGTPEDPELTFRIPKGEKGDKGDTGPQGPKGETGSTGQDGISPSISITDITGGHRVTITDATGSHSFDVMDGSGSEAPVQDVQVNGASILDEQGVANMQTATDNTFGVVKVATGGFYGIRYFNANNDTYKFLVINPATDEEIKRGSLIYHPIGPYRQHTAVFYGLAKAAGDTTQSASSNSVGDYTEDAKSAINEMLNGSVSVSGTAPTINAKAGIRYVCGEVSTLDITLPASGIVDVVFTSGSSPTVLTITPPTGQTVKWANGFDPTTLDTDTVYEINIADGLGVAVGWT